MESKVQSRYHYSTEAMVTTTAVPLSKDMTIAEFTALGANALVYIRPIQGTRLAQLLADPEFESEEEFHLIVSADGSPLMVADSHEAVSEWLDEMNLAVATLH